MEEIRLTVFERIMRELNVIAWAHECQFMKASTSVLNCPMLHNDGHYMSKIFIKSDCELGLNNIQDFIREYSSRYEAAINRELVINELKEVYQKSSDILDFYNNTLSFNSETVTIFRNNIPVDFKKMREYLKRHSGVIVVYDDLHPHHIVFESDEWNENLKFNYLVSNDQLSRYCVKLMDFIRKIIPLDDDTKDDNHTTKFYNLNKDSIRTVFEEMDETRGSNYAFNTEQDCLLSVDILARYFSGLDFQITKDPIKLKRRTKSKVASALNTIHFNLAEIELSKDIDFIRIVRIFDCFKDKSNEEIIDSILKRGRL